MKNDITRSVYDGLIYSGLVPIQFNYVKCLEKVTDMTPRARQIYVKSHMLPVSFKLNM